MTTPNIVNKVLKAWKISLICERMPCVTGNQISVFTCEKKVLHTEEEQSKQKW
jgi:hypothetical protein